MLNRFARALFTRLLTPVARVLLRLGVSPDVVTVVGTLGSASEPWPSTRAASCSGERS